MVDFAEDRLDSKPWDIQEQACVKVERKVVYRVIKRFLDIVLSFVALVILSPIFLITALAIKCEDSGSVIYKQIRIGKNCKSFGMYKFRSMKMNAEKVHEKMKKEFQNTEVSFKLKEDPRITKVGNFIRKFNIDELPQLINILKGDMSLVGPRPLPDYEYKEEQDKYQDKYIERYSVPQGLTCIWQISNRADVGFEKRMQMDVNYARKCSLWLDIILIVKTFLCTITGKAAY